MYDRKYETCPSWKLRNAVKRQLSSPTFGISHFTTLCITSNGLLRMLQTLCIRARQDTNRTLTCSQLLSLLQRICIRAYRMISSQFKLLKLNLKFAVSLFPFRNFITILCELKACNFCDERHSIFSARFTLEKTICFFHSRVRK